jgi:hypothetical protein
MTPSELKYHIESAGHEPYFFTRKTMRFFGDTMANYGCRRVYIPYCKVCITRREPFHLWVWAWELWRKHPVKHNLHSSAYFLCDTFERVHNLVEV